MEATLESENKTTNRSTVSETGHAKNVANLDLMNGHINALGTTYSPSNPKLTLANLKIIYITAFAQQETVNMLVAPYSLAVDNREMIFKPLAKQITKLRKAYKATAGVTQNQLEDFMTIARKLKGLRKTDTPSTIDSDIEQELHSVSQLSYDQRTNNMDLLISLLQHTQNYNPNETEFKVITYQALKTQMLQSTKAVALAFIPLNNARSKRNATVYNDLDNLVDTANKAKDYLFAILDTNSAQYKAIAKIKFKKA